jgi:release factor glutamine methyltransferase
VASDINPQAINTAIRRAKNANVENRIEFNVGDLFDGIKGKFDWILFNPPYLPSEGSMDELSWSGGTVGYETLKRFLDQAENFLKDGGSIILIYSSLTGLKLDKIKKKYTVEVLEELQLFYESLYCLLIQPLSLSESPNRSRL